MSISLIEHNSTGPSGNDISLVQRSYQPMLASGSGFVVNPAGSIVTSQAVTGADLQRAVVFAVNRVFNERYGDGAPIPSDPYAKAAPRAGSGDVVQKRLQRCYQPNTTDETGGCVVFVQRVVVVQPFVSDQKQFGNLPADVVYPPAGTQSDVAVLKVGASSMPSVVLGQTNADVEAVSTLGFTTTPSDEKSLHAINGHFTAKGASTLKADEFVPQIESGIKNGMAGGPVVSEHGQVVGFLKQDGKNLSLVGPDAIATALSAAGVKPGRGPTDLVYENALHNYNNQLYTAAAPNLTQVLKLYPGHALAAEKLAIANQRRGTSADKGNEGATDTSGFGPTDDGGSSGGTSKILIWGGLGAVVALALALGFVLFRGRRGKGDAGVPELDPNLAPVGYGYAPGMPLGAPYPGTAQAPPPESWGAPAPGWADPRFAGYQGAGNPAALPSGDSGAEQQTVLRLSPTNPPPASGPVSDGPGEVSGAPADLITRQTAACDQCNQPMAPGQQFCGYCGNRVH